MACVIIVKKYPAAAAAGPRPLQSCVVDRIGKVFLFWMGGRGAAWLLSSAEKKETVGHRQPLCS